MYSELRSLLQILYFISSSNIVILRCISEQRMFNLLTIIVIKISFKWLWFLFLPCSWWHHCRDAEQSALVQVSKWKLPEIHTYIHTYIDTPHLPTYLHIYCCGILHINCIHCYFFTLKIHFRKIFFKKNFMEKPENYQNVTYCVF